MLFRSPYLASPANCPEINHSHPYIICSSLESRVTAGLIYGDAPSKLPNGGVPILLPNINGSRVEPYIARMVIIEQFEMLKDFLNEFNGPTNKKRSQEWIEKVGRDSIDRMAIITDRRNELTHDKSFRMPTMKEAVEYFCECRNLAVIFHKKAVNTM